MRPDWVYLRSFMLVCLEALEGAELVLVGLLFAFVLRPGKVHCLHYWQIIADIVTLQVYAMRKEQEPKRVPISLFAFFTSLVQTWIGVNWLFFLPKLILLKAAPSSLLPVNNPKCNVGFALCSCGFLGGVLHLASCVPLTLGTGSKCH